jgi:hypothetical protein
VVCKFCSLFPPKNSLSAKNKKSLEFNKLFYNIVTSWNGKVTNYVKEVLNIREI